MRQGAWYAKAVSPIGRPEGLRRLVSTTEEEIRALVLEGKSWITHYGGQQTILFSNEETEQLKQEEEAMTEHILSNIIGTSLKSPQTIINKVYDKIGFNAIQDEELRHLVVSRICSPMSKKVTVDYLIWHFKKDVSLQKIYRYLDKLYNTQQELVQAISVEHTRELFGGNLGLLFYDVTTLYFETTEKDELSESGFSKDGKNSNPQCARTFGKPRRLSVILLPVQRFPI